MRFLRCAVVMVAFISMFGIDAFSAQAGAGKAYEKLKKEIEGVAKDTNKYGAKLKSTLQSLSKVSTSESKNQVKAVKSFQKDVDGLNKDLKKATDGIKNLRAKRDQYFSEWERSIAEISDPDLKKAAEERQQNVMANHTQLSERATALREKIDGFMKELSDLTTFLGSDPTAEAASASKPKIDKVLADGNAIASEVQEVSSQLLAFARGSS
jgi:DNA repair exonuclease SbcCD ATPase subunit